MTTLTPAQLASYDSAAGFTGNALITIVAIQLGESGGDTTAHNSNASTGDDSYGLSQINMLGALGPARLKEFGINANTDLYDPATNAKAAFTLYKQSGFNPWSVFTSGAYKSHLGDAETGVIENAENSSNGIPGAGLLSSAASKASDAVSAVPNAITNAVSSFSKTIFNSVADVAAVGLAISLLVIGFILLNRKSAGSFSKVAEVAAL